MPYWRSRLLADELTGKCNARIMPPDGDGLVYVVLNDDESSRGLCFGTVVEAKKLMSDWLAAYDSDEPVI